MNGLEALNEIKDPQASKWYLKRLDIIESELKVATILKEHIKVCDVIRDGNIVGLGLESKDTQAGIHIHLTQDEFTAIVEWLKGE